MLLKCNPFYSPHEFTSVILSGVYIPPLASAYRIQHELTDMVTDIEKAQPDSVVIIVGDSTIQL